MTAIAVAMFAGGLGFFIGWLLRQKLGQDRIARAEAYAKSIEENARGDAENLKKEKLLEARDEIFQKRQEFEQQVKSRQAEIQKKETSLNSREISLDRKVDILNRKERELAQTEHNLVNLEKKLSTREAEIEKLIAEENRRLEQMSGLTNDEAKRLQMENLLDAAKQEAAQAIKEIKDAARLTANREAREIVLEAIQRTAINHVAESTVSIVKLPNDDMKGRIIGREGRNIRTFEAATGIEVLIDDTPETVMLSGFNPIRRDVAKISLEKLLVDGRIHPGRIEEVVEKTRAEIEEKILEAGEQAMLEAGLHGIHPELLRLLGKLKYRTAHGQNLLQHSVEVGILSGLIGSQLDLDANIARRAGLLHEIGKAIDNDSDSKPGEAAKGIVSKYGENEIVQNAILASSGLEESSSIISPVCIVVAAANDISESRPGAHKEMLENYFQRLHQLEELSGSFLGVIRAYAIQAGREIRVMVEHRDIDDARAQQLAVDISKQIQEKVQYPGQIKVTVIREHRSIAYAK
jgi:ribonuclease Y